MVRPPLLVFGLLLAGAAVACVNTDPTVFVESTISKIEAQVSGGSLGTGFSGSFQLSLHLGPRATGPSNVSLGTFKILVNKDPQQEVVSTLPVKTDTPLPVTVDLDSDVDVPFTFDTGGKPLPSSAKSLLCDPAGVVLAGTIDDSLQNHSTPFTSEAFHPAGCM